MRAIIFVIFLLFATNLKAEKSLDLDVYLNCESVFHKLDKNFEVTDSGINKNYSFFKSSSSNEGVENGLTSDSGYNIKVDASFSPIDNLSMSSKINFVPKYADRFWIPVNDNHRLEYEGKDYRIENAEIKYITNIATLRYFKGIPHSSWRHKGDLFNFFPQQYEVDRYLRVSGRTPPEGYELSLATRYSSLQLVYGPEIVWGYRNGIYFRYNFNFGILNLNLFARSDIPDYIRAWNPDERMNSYQASFSYGFSSQLKGHLGFLYRPFRLNEKYEYYENGELKEGITKRKDALGIKSGFKYNPYFILNELRLDYSYLSPVAGNKEAVEVSGYRPLSKSSVLSGSLLFQEPVVGPIPLTYEGTATNPGQVYSNPRGPESPFWVSWYYDDWNNRKAKILKLDFVYDPTPSTWFFRYEPNVIEKWNLNPDEDAKFSFALEYKVSKYYSGMDRFYYWDEDGNVEWEPYGLTGPWETKNFLQQFKTVVRAKFYKLRLLSFISIGNSPALGSYAYDSYSQKKNGLVSVVDYYDFVFKVTRGKMEFNMRYAIDPWGPEEWHRVFGEKIDKLYRFGVNYRLNRSLNMGINYTRVKEDDFVIPPEIGSYKELRAYLNYRFGFGLNFED